MIVASQAEDRVVSGGAVDVVPALGSLQVIVVKTAVNVFDTDKRVSSVTGRDPRPQADMHRPGCPVIRDDVEAFAAHEHVVAEAACEDVQEVATLEPEPPWAELARSRRMMSQPSPGRYIAALDHQESAVTNIEDIDKKTDMGETMILGLRLLQDGVSAQSFARRHGVSLFDQFAPQLSRLASIGLLEVDDRGVRLTKRGALLANSVCAEFL